MKNKILIVACMLLLVTVISACSKQPDEQIDSPAPETEVLQTAVDIQPELQEEVLSSGIEKNSDTESEPSEQPVTEPTQTGSSVEQNDEKSHSAVEPDSQTPVETEPPKQPPTQPTVETAPPTTPAPTEQPKEEPPTEPSEPTAPEPTQEPVIESYDIEAHLSFARSSAQSIGLTLDSTATDCWDNPISANPNLSNVNENIASRLNRYKNTDGFTAVWIWAVQVSDNGYQIYIGYA